MSTRNVRLGIVYRGSIVREEILDRRVDVSVGLRADSTVQFSPNDYPDFPEHVDLLLVENNLYYLAVPSDPNARINLRGASSADNVQTIRGRRCIPVDDIAGGSMVVGDLTVMFQFVRGYSTPTEIVDRTVLRIGLVFNERLISDRIYPHQKQVSIGASKADTVVLDNDDYKGPSLTFTNNKDGSVDLKTPQDMNLRAAVEGTAPLDLKELIAKGKARKTGSDVTCHLALGTRGRAIMGPYTVLFQVVRQRVVVPAMEKKTVLQRFISVFLGDVVWTACFGIAFLLGGGVVVQALLFQSSTGQYLKQVQQEKQHSELYEIEVEQKEEIKPPEPEPEEPKEETQIEPEEKNKKPDESKKPAAKPEKAEKPESIGKTVDKEEAKRNARKVIAKTTIAGAFMGDGAKTKLFAEGGEGEGAEVMAKTFGGDGGTEGEGPGSAVKLKGGGGGGTMEKIKGGKPGGFGKRKQELTKAKIDKKEAAVKVSLSLGELGGSGSGKAGIAQVIARKASAVRRCYEAALRTDPGLSGKVKVSFTVGTAGTITSVTVLGAQGGFADCIKSKFSMIRGLPILPAPQSFSQSYVFTKS